MKTKKSKRTPPAGRVGSGALLALLDDLAKSEVHQTLRGSIYGVAREFGLKFPRQELPLMCAERDLMLLLHRGTLNFIILRRSQWQDLAR